MDDKTIKEKLLKEDYVTAEDMKKAETYAKARHVSFLDYFFIQGLLNTDTLGQAIAESFKVVYADLNSNPPTRDQVLLIPEEIGKKYHVVLFRQEKSDVVLATDDPGQEGLLAALKPIFPKKKITLAYANADDIEKAFIHYRKTLETRFSKILLEKTRVAPEILEEIIGDAMAFGASDIHFEPQGKEVVVRFRIDGVLKEAARIAVVNYENILNRIKIQAHLRIDEHFSAQDGAIRFEREGHVIDMRVSVVPTTDGEKVAIRLLSEYVRNFTLSDLGLLPDDQKFIIDAVDRPFGMILVTGPTGSGKTTTLYAVLKTMNDPEVNITTIEDPVEYKILGINQIQVSQQTNLTFAEGLRSIVRQDPDVILVGEIRDRDTAEIAVNAALTGHLLLSTFHANDAATAIPRLLDMGVEPFLLASTLEIVVAQRLVRKICESCRVSRLQPQAKIHEIFPGAEKYFSGKISMYSGKGCDACNQTGFKGRTGIYEFIPVTKEMKELILHNPSTSKIWELAEKQGGHRLFDDGIAKVKAGITTLEELLRVVQPPS